MVRRNGINHKWNKDMFITYTETMWYDVISYKLNNNTFYNPPGTMWCGHGTLASDLTQLGSRSGTDRCCQIHDLCPVQLVPFVGYRGVMTAGPKTLWVADPSSFVSVWLRCLLLVDWGFSVSNWLRRLFLVVWIVFLGRCFRRLLLVILSVFVY